MKATQGPGAHHERWFPFYARGLSRGKFSRSTRPGRGVADPSAVVVETSFALGGDYRGHDAPLAPQRQKCRWWAGIALGCLLICALGGADADQGLRFASDGSLFSRE